MEKFLNTLKLAWCGSPSAIQSIYNESYGDELDIKFRNSLHFELDDHEIVIVQLLRSSRPLKKKGSCFFTASIGDLGNLVLLTSMNRLLWITDQYRERREHYASVSISAPASPFTAPE